MKDLEALDDARLAAAARDGDRTAYESLVTLHKAVLYRLARQYTGNSDDAYDIVQDTFVSAWLALSSFDPTRGFGPWIRTILLNKCRDFSRRRSVKKKVLRWLAPSEATQAESAQPDDPGDSELRGDPRLRVLDKAIAELPARYKEPLVLTALQGLSHREVAHQLGLTAKAVELRVHRARKRLQELLHDRDV